MRTHVKPGDSVLGRATTLTPGPWHHASWLAAVALTLAAGSGVAATAATAASASAPSGRIYACATRDYGTLNLSAATRRCPAGQHKVSWKSDTGRVQAGRTGARGAGGRTGAAGAAGRAGEQGATGATGEAGALGAAGLMGSAGMPGAMGEQGMTGPAGLAGPTGADGARGAAGPAGTTGADGARGAAGANGAVGTTGATGASGQAGAQGEQGYTGAQGEAGEAGAGSPADYGYVFNEREQVVEIGADVAFDQTGVTSQAISHKPGSTDIQVDATGNYEVRFIVSGSEPSQFALAVKDEVLPGTTYGSGAGTQQNAGSVIVSLARGDALTLRNVGSDSAVTLASAIGGKRQTVNASVTITRLPDGKDQG
jgi:hypothetical protein